ncbi:hypothetical protein [Halostagnicola bangensis]
MTPAIVPFDATIGITAAASVALALFVGFMLYLTFITTPDSATAANQPSSTQSNASAETAEPTD